jgi:hypothetical protein
MKRTKDTNKTAGFKNRVYIVILNFVFFAFIVVKSLPSSFLPRASRGRMKVGGLSFVSFVVSTLAYRGTSATARVHDAPQRSSLMGNATTLNPCVH